jgi:hypothetical protein
VDPFGRRRAPHHHAHSGLTDAPAKPLVCSHRAVARSPRAHARSAQDGGLARADAKLRVCPRKGSRCRCSWSSAASAGSVAAMTPTRSTGTSSWSAAGSRARMRARHSRTNARSFKHVSAP